MTNKAILAKLTAILNKINDNSINAWEDNLADTKSVVITDDFNKNLNDEEHPEYDPELDVKYNGWLEELEALEKELKEEGNIPPKRDNKSFHDSIEAAAKLLCDNTAELGDDNIHEQVKRIAAHPNQSDLIDNVEGVIVWEKVVGSFTCEEFLEYIDWN